MAGVGFELKKLFAKEGIINRLKAYTFSSTVIVGPMLLTMFMILGMQIIMVNFDFPYFLRQLFLSGVIYSFIFSYLITSIFSLLLTRNIADLIYTRAYSDILHHLYRLLHVLLPLAAILGCLYLFFVPLDWEIKITVYVFFMELTLIWTLSAFISTVKEYKKIMLSFLLGITSGLLGTYILFAFTSYHSVASVMLVLNVAFLLTIVLLWWNIETLFYSSIQPQRIRYRSFYRYPSLIFIGSLSALGLFSHQLIEWLGPNGMWVEGSYLLAPNYDVAVYYAFLSIIPTLVTSVVNLETEFYLKYKRFYDLVFNNGTIRDVHEARDDMAQVLIKELAKIMGIQLFFSVLCIALGYRLLPLIGFTIEQMETFSILVMGFYLYITYIVITVVLLYFDDRMGTLGLTILFLCLSTLSSILLLHYNQQGLAFVLSALITLIIALVRLLHILRNLLYFTFCAQPLVTKKEK